MPTPFSGVGINPKEITKKPPKSIRQPKNISPNSGTWGLGNDINGFFHSIATAKPKGINKIGAEIYNGKFPQVKKTVNEPGIVPYPTLDKYAIPSTPILPKATQPQIKAKTSPQQKVPQQHVVRQPKVERTIDRANNALSGIMQQINGLEQMWGHDIRQYGELTKQSLKKITNTLSTVSKHLNDIYDKYSQIANKALNESTATPPKPPVLQQSVDITKGAMPYVTGLIALMTMHEPDSADDYANILSGVIHYQRTLQSQNYKAAVERWNNFLKEDAYKTKTELDKYQTAMESMLTGSKVEENLAKLNITKEQLPLSYLAQKLQLLSENMKYAQKLMELVNMMDYRNHMVAYRDNLIQVLRSGTAIKAEQLKRNIVNSLSSLSKLNAQVSANPLVPASVKEQINQQLENLKTKLGTMMPTDNSLTPTDIFATEQAGGLNAQ